MAEDIARIDVVATVIYCGDKVLLVDDDNWGGFALPMTKLRRRPPGPVGKGEWWETGADAAMRNVGRCLGLTFARPPGLLGDVRKLRQRGPNGQVDDYRFQVYGFLVDEPRTAPGVIAQWLSADQILDPMRRPISPTTRTLVSELKEFGLTRGGFPPAPPMVPPRQSVASEAIITRQRQTPDRRLEPKQWLCQWNGNWGRFFLVGGHREKDEQTGEFTETVEECLYREMEQELGLTHGVHYQAHQRGEPLQFGAWSTSSWQPTDYEMTAFDIELHEAARASIEANPDNRWLTKEEILSERCADGRLISLTTRQILLRLGELRD